MLTLKDEVRKAVMVGMALCSGSYELHPVDPCGDPQGPQKLLPTANLTELVDHLTAFVERVRDEAARDAEYELQETLERLED